MNKLQISQKLRGILRRMDYISFPKGELQGELLNVKVELEELRIKLKREYLEENPI